MKYDSENYVFMKIFSKSTEHGDNHDDLDLVKLV